MNNAGIILIVVNTPNGKKVCPIIAIAESVWDRLNHISDHDLLKMKTNEGFFSKEEFQSVINGEIKYKVIRVHYKDASVSDVEKLIRVAIFSDLSSFITPDDIKQIPCSVRYDAYMFTCDSMLNKCVASPEAIPIAVKQFMKLQSFFAYKKDGDLHNASD